MGSSAGASDQVYVHNLNAYQSLVRRSSEFEAAIHNRERSSLRLFCYKRSQESKSEDDRETWGFLKAMFEDDETARTKLLTHFGSLPWEAKDTREYDLSQEACWNLASAIGLEDEAPDKEEYDADKNTYLYDDREYFDYYLPSPPAETPVLGSGDGFTVGGSVPIVEEMQQEMDGQEDTDNPSFSDSIQCALVVGNYKGAVAHCIAANKMADALVIAHVGGGSLWESTRDQYLKMSSSPHLEVISAMVDKDPTSLVNTRPLISLKETLALLCTFALGEKWSSLCDSLASRLMTVDNTLPATLFYICAGNIDKTVEIWSRSLISENSGDHFQDFMEKTMVLALATGQKQFSASTCKLVEKCAEILTRCLTTAKEYLNLMRTDESSPELMILQDCVAWSTEIENEVPTSSALENSLSLPGATYEAEQSSLGAVESSRHYHQETTSSQPQHGVSGSPYGENCQPSFGSSYAGGYGAPVPYQPAPNPQTFLPSQAPQVPQGRSTTEASLLELQAAISPLTEDTRICIRDALYRLAKDAEKMHSPIHGNTSRLENTTTVDPKTNAIDKAVATLLWSQRQNP